MSSLEAIISAVQIVSCDQGGCQQAVQPECARWLTTVASSPEDMHALEVLAIECCKNIADDTLLGAAEVAYTRYAPTIAVWHGVLRAGDATG
jgi:hypothetical protein